MKISDPEVAVYHIAQSIRRAVLDDGGVFPLSEEHLMQHCLAVAAVGYKGILTAVGFEGSGCDGQMVRYSVRVE